MQRQWRQSRQARRSLAWVLVILGAACSRSEKQTQADAENIHPDEQRYPLHGEIVAINREHKKLTISHEAIPGLMPAMTMEFRADDGDLASVTSGERIRAELVRAGDDFHLEKIWPDDRVSTSRIAAAANALRQDTVTRGAKAYREIGENMPDFALYDQDGRVVQASRFRGRQIMLNFIYTRCPVATMCPAATLRMMAVQKQAREAHVPDLQLISITLDPEYDTPGVLKQYAAARAIDTGNFSFLTGPEAAIRDLLAQFGVIAEFKDGLLRHSLATLLINEEGRIVHRADGSEWSVEEFVEKMPKGVSTE
jgi:protein SCO1/2